MRTPVLVWGKLVIAAFAFAKGAFSSAWSEGDVTIGADLVITSLIFQQSSSDIQELPETGGRMLWEDSKV